jgi:hypothetical protein
LQPFGLPSGHREGDIAVAGEVLAVDHDAVEARVLRAGRPCAATRGSDNPVVQPPSAEHRTS